MGKRTKPLLGKKRKARTFYDPKSRHEVGDKQAYKAFNYERGWRCIWLLELRGTDDKLSAFTGEDCVIEKAKERFKIYRQVKKRETWQWPFNEMRELIERAYKRFINDPNVLHEFYTDANVSPNITIERGDGVKHLDPDSYKIRGIADKWTEKFCLSFTIYERERHADPDRMREDVVLAIRKEIAAVYKDRVSAPYDLAYANNYEIFELANRLLAAESTLLSRGTSVTWDDVNKEIGFDALLHQIDDQISADGAWHHWETIAKAPHNYLFGDLLEAFQEVQEGRAIQRPVIEKKVLDLFSSWISTQMNSETSIRQLPKLLLLVGMHGVGKTWAMMRIGKVLADEFRDVDVCIAPGPPPEDFSEFRNIQKTLRTRVVLVDRFFEGWDSVNKIADLYLVPNLLFIGTASLVSDSPEIEKFKEILRDMIECVEVDTALTEEEGVALINIVRKGYPLAHREKINIKWTNIRHARQLLSGQRPLPFLADLRLLFQREKIIQDQLSAILFSTKLGIRIPLSLVQRAFDNAIANDLEAWLIRSCPIGETMVTFEDPREAEKLIEEKYLSMEADFARYYYGILIEKSDPNKFADRLFLRLLFSKLTKRDGNLLRQLLIDNRRKIEILIQKEPLWPLAFCWLPAFAKGKSVELIQVSTRRLSSDPPKTIAEFVLWLQIFGVEAALRELGQRIQRLPECDPQLITNVAAMIRRLPAEARSSIARQFCSMLIHLSPETFFDSLQSKNSFELITTMLAEYGGPYDRQKAVDKIGDLIAGPFVMTQRLQMSRVESYVNLVNRAFQQKRSGLSLLISKAILENDAIAAISWAQGSFNEIFEIENRMSVTGLVSLGLRVFAMAESQTYEFAATAIPNNILKLAACWAKDEDWQTLAERYVAGVDRAESLCVPIDRISSLISAGFGPIRRGPLALCQAFLRTTIRLLIRPRQLETDEFPKLLFMTLRLVSKQPWLENAIRLRAESVMGELIDTRAVICDIDVSEFLHRLATILGVQTRHDHVDLLLPKKWWEKTSLATIYLTNLVCQLSTSLDRTKIAQRIKSLWGSNPRLFNSLSSAFLRLNQNDEAEHYASLVKDPPLSFLCAKSYLLIAAARRPNITLAYSYLSEIQRIGDDIQRRLPLCLASWIYQELARVTSSSERILHILCRELTLNRRLRHYNDVVAAIDYGIEDRLDDLETQVPFGE